ncbi:energy-coupling factor transporter ATPase [Desulfofundulus thermosubterraneus]|uniref:Energy-coupling factor transporter ATP-binding protein EcfA2 n=1 Tax=Desulfofundulus thermosubterraneus DSM 16057 TaxID=1121432 RepID=A0A1M6GAQ0_9FIRM|nr:energy-coupling factor transporter ATPase [Desulfofundulus thermosubterraneus]SHJ07025.1 energy-coupling factor transport system ATP-binding protein [Desulfofundulus thermosubterraneus DSM 16057]
MILVEHLTHIYAPGTPLALTSLEDVSLRIEEGEFVVLAGATGSGKTTLVQHFNGLLLPTAGRVLVDGRDTRDKRVRRDLWRTVGLLFQNPEQQLFEENVFAEVAFGCRNLGLDEGTIEIRVRRALEMVGLEPVRFGTLSPFALSRGQQRRVALAGVLAYRPRVLVLDEPTSGLDPAAREQIWQMLKGMQQHGHTVVVITHHMEDAARYADRVVVLHRGKIYRQGTPRQVFGDPEGLRAVGLDVPMPGELMYRLRQRGLPVNTGILTLDEAEAELKKLAPSGKACPVM